MKRLFTTILAIGLFSLYAIAGSDITVIEGNKKLFKTISGTANLQLVWDGATYDNKEPLTAHFPDLDRLALVAQSGFTETFNDKCKSVKVVPSSTQARYKFTMQVTNMDRYIKVMGFIPGPATKVWGTLTITDTQTGETLAVIRVDEVDGGASPSPDESFSDCFEELAKQVAKLK